MPGPYRSILNDHVKEIADLRKTHPPTPYSRIAEILKEKHGIIIGPSSIWSFVKARSIEGERKVKYVIAEDASPHPEIPQTAASPEGSRQKNTKPLYQPEREDPFKI